MKTLVVASHPGGPHENGFGGCFTRWLNGFCAGTRQSEWLNSLGEDDELYGGGIIKVNGHRLTNGDVRINWMHAACDCKVVPLEPKQAALLERQSRLRKELTQVNNQLAACRVARKTAK